MLAMDTAVSLPSPRALLRVRSSAGWAESFDVAEPPDKAMHFISHDRRCLPR